MIRIQFVSERDRVQGNDLLATRTVVRRLRGQIFEIAERDLNILDEHQLHYTLVPIPDPSSADDALRNPLTVELEKLSTGSWRMRMTSYWPIATEGPEIAGKGSAALGTMRSSSVSTRKRGPRGGDMVRTRELEDSASPS